MIERLFGPAARGSGPRIICGAVAVVAATLILPANADAQRRTRGYMGTLTYSPAVPTGDTKNFVDDFSWLGFTLEGDWFGWRDDISTGFIIGWQELYQESNNDSFEFPIGTTTGRTYRHISAIPLLFRGRYWANADKQIQPFVGAGVGTYWMKQMLDFGIYTGEEDHWHFGVAPEVGVMFTTRGGVGWTLNARYNYPFKAGDYLSGDSKSWAYWGIGMGVGMAR